MTNHARRIWRRRTTNSARPLLLVLVLALAFAGVGCPCVRNTVNGSESLRWWLFSTFGASRMCPEMLKRGVPFKMAWNTASIGRFFPQQCRVQVDEATHSIVMTANGTGYAMLPLARRVGFYAALSVEYRPDFRMEEDAIYVWGRFNRLVSPPELRLLGVESAMVNLATRTPLGDVATVIGQGILASEIGRGFTVVRQDDGDAFALGILQPPEKPKRAFASGGRTLAATDMTEVHASSREYLGPIEVPNGGAIFVKTTVTGPALVYAVVTKQVGDAWRQPYEAAQPLAAPPGPVIASGLVQPGSGAISVAVGPGLYYVVLENRSPAPAAPFGMSLALGEAVAVVSYAIEVGP